MKWALDNTVMSNFGLIERYNWLRKLGENNFLTVREAWDELQVGIEKGVIPQGDWSWLTIARLTETEHRQIMRIRPPLDLGEAASLVLAQQRGYGIMTDDRVARRYARLMAVPLSGTLGILKMLADLELITMPEADEALSQMIELGYFSPVTSLAQLR